MKNYVYEATKIEKLNFFSHFSVKGLLEFEFFGMTGTEIELNSFVQLLNLIRNLYSEGTLELPNLEKLISLFKTFVKAYRTSNKYFNNNKHIEHFIYIFSNSIINSDCCRSKISSADLGDSIVEIVKNNFIKQRNIQNNNVKDVDNNNNSNNNNSNKNLQVAVLWLLINIAWKKDRLYFSFCRIINDIEEWLSSNSDDLSIIDKKKTIRKNYQIDF